MLNTYVVKIPVTVYVVGSSSSPVEHTIELRVEDESAEAAAWTVAGAIQFVLNNNYELGRALEQSHDHLAGVE